MAILRIPFPKPLRFARDYDKVMQTAEQQRVRAREMKEAARDMCDHAAEMRAERPFSFPWADLDRSKE